MRYFIEPSFETDQRIPAVSIGPDVSDAGALPHVIVLHGLEGSKDYWVSFLYSLAKAGFVAVAPDLRLHGEWPDAGRRPEILGRNFAEGMRTIIYDSAKDVSRLIDGWRSQPSGWGVVGISAGGLTAHVLAIQEKRFKAMSIVLSSPDWLTADPSVTPPAWSPAGLILKSLSPINHHEKYAPLALQMLCGEVDATVNPIGSKKLYERLRPVYDKMGIAARLDLQVAPGYAHDYHADQQAETVRWLARWLAK